MVSAALESSFKVGGVLVIELHDNLAPGVSLRAGSVVTTTLFTVADGDTLQVDRAARLQAGGVLKINHVTVIFFDRIPRPEELVIRKSSVTRTMEATRTMTPTFNCDHRTSCWLGIALLVVYGRKGMSRGYNTVPGGQVEFRWGNISRGLDFLFPEWMHNQRVEFHKAGGRASALKHDDGHGGVA